MNEQEYTSGSQRAWLTMLAECLRQLGYDVTEASAARWVKERHDAILQLRTICATHGDNEWPDDLYLADIIEKHLARHIRLTPDPPAPPAGSDTTTPERF